MLMRNATGSTLRFSIDGMPAVPPTVYEVEPGDVCDVPDGYCVDIPKLGPTIHRIVTGLVLAEPAAVATEFDVTETSSVGHLPALEPAAPVLEGLRKKKGKA